MAMGTLPVAALADTAVETQANDDYRSMVTDNNLDYSYHGTEYKDHKNGETQDVSGVAFDDNDYYVNLKSIGDLTFDRTGFDTSTNENQFDVYDGTVEDGTKVGTAEAVVNYGNETLTVNYTFDGSSASYSATTTIELNFQDRQDTSNTYLELVDQNGNQVTSNGKVTYNGEDQYLAAFQNGVAVTKVTLTANTKAGSKSTAANVTSGTYGDIAVVKEPGQYAFDYTGDVTDAQGNTKQVSGTMRVTVGSLDLGSADVRVIDTENGADIDSLVINGVQVKGNTELQSHLKVEVKGTEGLTRNNNYQVTVSAKTDGTNPDYVTGSKTAETSQVQHRYYLTYDGELYGGKSYTNAHGNGALGVSDYVIDKGVVDLDDKDKSAADKFDEGDVKVVGYNWSSNSITALPSGLGDDDFTVTYVKLDGGSTVSKADALNKTGHYMAVIQVKKNTQGGQFTTGGKYFIKWTNVRKGDDYKVAVRFDGKMVESGAVGKATYDGDAIPYSVTVKDNDGDEMSSDAYDVHVYKLSANGAQGDEVTEIRHAGYYKLVVTGKDGENLTGSARVTYLYVAPVEIVAQVSADGQVQTGESWERITRSYFDYTGTAVSPKYDFFKRDDDGEYVEYKYSSDQSASAIVKLSDLSQDEQADYAGGQRYSKVDVPEDAYTVTYYNSNGDKVSASDLKDKGTYNYVVRDDKADVEDDYEITTGNFSRIRISAERVFEDVANDAWYAQVVNDAAAKGYVNGYSGTNLFGPEDNITRGQVACILYNMGAGKLAIGQNNNSYNTQTGYETGFSDVNGNAYYARAIAWAKDAGVVNGYGDGTFRPDQNVTREEFAAMLANYAQKVRNYEAGSTSELDAFPDGSSVSDWAKDVVAWAVHNKVMGNGGFINPQGSITRAETAAMVMNFDAIKR